MVRVLQLDHHFGQSINRHLVFALFFPSLADLVILAVTAFEIAVTEKNVANTVRAHERRFFAKVRTIGRDDRKPRRVTSRNLTGKPIDLAIERTDIARCEHSNKLLGAPRKLARCKDRSIWRIVHVIVL
jgi:hypothetical protein